MEIDWAMIETWFLNSGMRIALILLAGFAGYWIVSWLGKGVQAVVEGRARARDTEEELYKRANTLTRVINNLAKFVFVFVVALFVLGELQVPLGPFLAGAGIAGVALGFGAQTMVRDYLNGFFILSENQYRVGDVIRTANVAGLVESVNLRSTVVRDLEGLVHTIPNGEVTVVTNFTKTYSRFVLDVGVAYKENVDHVMEVLNEIGAEILNDETWGGEFIEPPQVMGVEQFADSAVVIRVRITTKPRRQWDVARELRRRIKNTFDQRGIEFPFPHRTVYFGRQEIEEQRKRFEGTS